MKQIIAWKCDYCGKSRISKKAMKLHEQICFENPDRKILENQLAIFETLPRELLVTDSYGVPGSEWKEPNYLPNEKLSPKYKWWPRDKDGAIDIGYIYQSGEWRRIKGYKYPIFAPGYAWKDEVVPTEYRNVLHCGDAV